MNTVHQINTHIEQESPDLIWSPILITLLILFCSLLIVLLGWYILFNRGRDRGWDELGQIPFVGPIPFINPPQPEIPEEVGQGDGDHIPEDPDNNNGGNPPTGPNAGGAAPNPNPQANGEGAAVEENDVLLPPNLNPGQDEIPNVLVPDTPDPSRASRSDPPRLSSPDSVEVVPETDVSDDDLFDRDE